MFNPDINIFSIARRIGRPLILDGAIGSLLQQKFGSKNSLWMSYLNLQNPEAVLKVHKDYIKAGADIIATNTFRTNPAALKNHKGLLSKSLVNNSVKIAKKAANQLPVILAGSNPPAEDCYERERSLSQKELETNHNNHIKYLKISGVHLILNETQSHFDEIEIICKYCSIKNIPFIISIYFEENLRILSGERLKDVIKSVLPYAPLAIGFNCINPDTFLKFFNTSKLNYNWGVYFNCGAGHVTDENFMCGISPDDYGKYVTHILTKCPSFIGACCGSSPKHIKEIKRILDGRNYN